MTNINALLDKARELCSPQTDYRLAKQLGVSQQRLGKWRRGATPNIDAAQRLAQFLRMPLADIIGYTQEDDAKKHNDEARAARWTATLPRLLPTVAIAYATLLAGWGSLTVGTSEAAQLRGETNITTGQLIHYAK